MQNNKSKNIPRASNKHASVALSGYALTQGGIVVYLSLVGSKNTARSIYASTVNNPRQTFSVDRFTVSGGDSKHDSYSQFWQDLPEQSAAHLVVAHKALFDVIGKGDHPFYLLATEYDLKDIEVLTVTVPDDEIACRYYRDESLAADTGARLAEAANKYVELYFDHPSEGRIEALDTPEHWAILQDQACKQRQDQWAVEVLLLPRFIALLNKSLDIPLHKTWAKTMWDAGLRHELIGVCKLGGHVRAAYSVLTTPTKWQDIVQEGLGEGALVMPQADSPIAFDATNEIGVGGAGQVEEATCA